MRTTMVLAAIALVPTTAPAARADPPPQPPITDRDWTLDLYDGAVLGSVRIVGMGGAQVALAEGSAGTLSNPAAPAVRKATSTGWWDWDFHLDALDAVTASDFDGNGTIDRDRVDRHVTFGLAGMLYQAGVAVTGSTSQTTLAAASGGPLVATASVAKLALARWLGRYETWTIGAGLRVGALTIDGSSRLFSISGAGLEAGVVYRPYRADLRLAASASLPITGENVSVASCDPEACEGHILPLRVAVPWQIAAGAAWRFAPTGWNQWVAGRFRDERALIVAGDLVVTGGIRDGMGLEAFGQDRWQAAGRHASVGVRAGAEWEALPGRLRLRGGSYWEPSRYEGVGGRIHATAGVEVGFLTFHIWWHRIYRLRAGITGDFASRFSNAGLSLGFWG